MANDYDVIIIGAGVGGLTSASLLSKEGLKVLVLESLDRVGGCCSNYDVGGFKP
ncbi:MAG: FAD-dependent oxidoreductase, partial [Actinomycetota bacterium]